MASPIDRRANDAMPLLQSAVPGAFIAILTTLCLGLGIFYSSKTAAQEIGLTDSSVRVGGVMDLEGDSRGLGLGMKAGIEAALTGEQVQGHSFEFISRNDFYNPQTTITATQELIDLGVFAMLGNVGTPTAVVSLPILAKNNVPAIGFFTGAGLLRPGVGDIFNYRASYVQETAKVIEAALKAGVSSNEICAYVQNDAYGMAGVSGIKEALEGQPDVEQTIAILDTIIAMEGANPNRNYLGPVGVYTRNTLTSKAGYESLKDWEAASGHPCRLVVSVGTYIPIARFAAYSRFKGENWVISAVSFTGADNFATELKKQSVTDKVVMTQVVPPLDSPLPIVQEARTALGDEINYVSMEGYIAAKMFLTIMRNIAGPITRQNFIDAARGSTFDLGGLLIDFSNDNQGSDFVLFTYLTEDGFRPVDESYLRQIF